MKKSFTLVEILVVATIIALLTAAGAVSYSTLSKNSRDAKRKADLEQVRAALEMYRSENDEYPTVTINCSSSGGITDGSNTYLSSIPKDPKCNTNSYYYTTIGTPASDYTLGAYLEGDSTSTCGVTISCVIGNCNYCVGPYGQK